MAEQIKLTVLEDSVGVSIVAHDDNLQRWAEMYLHETPYDTKDWAGAYKKAAFMVTAVNNHDAMVRAVQWYRNKIEDYLEGEYGHESDFMKDLLEADENAKKTLTAVKEGEK